jgi:hypothetical protein
VKIEAFEVNVSSLSVGRRIEDNAPTNNILYFNRSLALQLGF